MIHQLIFAYPRPGMSEEEFHRYWLEEHAVRYASKIPGIAQYAVDTRITTFGPGGDPLWCGAAEIFFRNDEDQLASLQTDEFLQGARLDEPRWAAFWRTLVLDTDPRVLLEGPPVRAEDREAKLFVLVKRAGGTTRAEFARRCDEKITSVLLDVPGLSRLVRGDTRDGAYAVGEAPLDAAFQLWFPDAETLQEAASGQEYRRALDAIKDIAEPDYVHELAFVQNWVISP